MPDSLLFDGSNDEVSFDAGGFAGNPPDAFSFFAVVKRGSDADFDGIAYGGEFNTHGKFGLSVRADDLLLSDTVTAGGQGETEGSGATTNTMNLLVAAGWCIVGYTKAAGTVVPVFHKYVFSTDTWTHENAGGALVQNACGGAFDELVVGCWKDDGALGDFFNGNIGLVGFWDTSLGNGAAVEAVFAAGEALLQTWVDANPLELLRMDSAGAITATVGAATEQSRVGTSLDSGDMPAGWDDSLGDPPQTVLPDADTVTTGWTSTPLFSKVNDSSDATIVQATLA